MSVIEPIKVEGLVEFQRALKQMDGESQKKLRVVLNTVGDSIAQGAARRVPTRTGAARASLRASSSQREARVSGGSRKVPYYGWLDFGGAVGKDKSVKRRFITAGRYIYPTLSANRDSITKALDKALTDLARDAGLKVN